MTRRYEVRVTESAFEDLREAAIYVRATLGAPRAAHDLIEKFEAQVLSLETFPEGRPLVGDYELARQGYRWCPVGNFMLFYTVDGDTNVVTVERLLYGRRDWQSLLG